MFLKKLQKLLEAKETPKAIQSKQTTTPQTEYNFHAVKHQWPDQQRNYYIILA